MASISVVIPTWNSRSYLPDLLDTLRKLGEQPGEYVMVDGQSSDGTLQMLQEFAPGVPVKILSRVPRGVYDAWNEGVKAASGEWIWIVCADDLVALGSIGTLRQQLMAGVPDDVGLVGWPISCVDESGAVVADQAMDSPLLGINRDLLARSHIRSAGLEAALIYSYRGYFLSFMSHAFRRQVWLEQAFDGQAGPSADIKWTMQVHLRGWRKLHRTENLASWRVQSQSITSSFSPEKRLRAHDELRRNSLPQLAALLQLDEAGQRVWKGRGFAHDAYDWFAVLRSARAPGAFFTAAGGVLASAGVMGTIRLALGRLGWLPRGGHAAAARQFLARFGRARLAAAIEWCG